MNRKSPFGQGIIKDAQELPNYILGIREETVSSNRGRDAVIATLTVSVGLQNPPHDAPSGKKKQKGLGMTSVLVITSDDNLVNFRRVPYVAHS